MNNVNKTLFIPLYGKALVSKKGLFLEDKKAEEIWSAEGFKLKSKSKSKWLAYFMGIRAAVFDSWVNESISNMKEAVVIHIGCGLDSRVLRVKGSNKWYDVDFLEVIEERKKYYSESDKYHMIAGDVRKSSFFNNILETNSAIVVMEGVSMYLSTDELNQLITNLCNHFNNFVLLMDCYTTFGVKMSKYKNPIKDVGVKKVYGIDEGESLNREDFIFVKEREMIPIKYIEELHGVEKFIFKKLYAGSFSKKIYRLYEYRK